MMFIWKMVIPGCLPLLNNLRVISFSRYSESQAKDEEHQLPPAKRQRAHSDAVKASQNVSVFLSCAAVGALIFYYSPFSSP